MWEAIQEPHFREAIQKYHFRRKLSNQLLRWDNIIKIVLIPGTKETIVEPLKMVPRGILF